MTGSFGLWNNPTKLARISSPKTPQKQPGSLPFFLAQVTELTFPKPKPCQLSLEKKFPASTSCGKDNRAKDKMEVAKST